MSNNKSVIKRGRTGSDLPPAMKQTDKGLTDGSREDAAHSAGRPPRISMHNMKKLEIPKSLMEDGYYYRWFQDIDGRINQAKAAYYEHVSDEQGNNLTCQSGNYTMYAMKLPQQYRDEDNALKRDRVAATMEKEAQLGINEYAPDRETGRAEGGRTAVTHENVHSNLD